MRLARLGAAIVAFALASVGLGYDAPQALAAPPVTPQIRFQQVEPLCVVSMPGASCTPSTQTGATPGLTSIIDFDYGSPLGQPSLYAGPGWQTVSPAPDVAVGDIRSQIDLFCEGTPDILATAESTPPSVVRAYPLAANADPIENWLLERIPSPTLYPVQGRSSSELNALFLGGLNRFETASPLALNLVEQQVTWSPGGGARVTQPVLGGRHDPAGYPPLCLQSRQLSTAGFPGRVATLTATATLASPATTVTVVIPSSQVSAGFRMFAGSDDCPLREGDRVQTGDPQRWAVTFASACIGSGDKVRVTFWAQTLPTAVTSVEFGGTRSTLGHELGHALCLTHPPGWSPDNFMNEVSTSGELLLQKQTDTARICGGTFLGSSCASGCAVPLTFVRVGTDGQSFWDTTKIKNFLAEANEPWVANGTGITFTWNQGNAGALINLADPGPGTNGDIRCPVELKSELDALGSQAGKSGTLRVFLINDFVDVNALPGCGGLIGFTKWPNNTPGGIGQFVAVAKSASKTADAVVTATIQTPLASASLLTNPSAAGLYQRWSVAGVTVPWAANKTDKRSPGLDISVDLRCYYFTASGTPKAPPGGLDDDNDCLASSAQAPLPADTNNANPDADGDTLVDGVEAAWGSNPADSDTDNDSLDDFIELYLGTNPNLKDTDGDTKFDPIDNCPLTSNATQADADKDAWVTRRVRAYRTVIQPADANDGTDPKTVIEANVIAGQLKDGAPPISGMPVEQPFVIQATGSPAAGGDACDSDDENDRLPDAVECSNAAGACTKSKPPNGVSVVILPEIPELYPNATAPLGIVCVNSDVDHDGDQEASSTALAQKLGILPSQVIGHVVAVRQSNADSDADGWRDGFECGSGANPASSASTPETANGIDDDGDGVIDEVSLAADGGAGDVDGDRLFNVLELNASTACVRVGVGGQLPHNPLDHCASQPRTDLNSDAQFDVENDADGDGVSGLLDIDADGDTFSDAIEVGQRGTMAHQADSDGDGCKEGVEINQTNPARPTNPIDARDHFDVNGDNRVDTADISNVVSVFGRNITNGTYPGVRVDRGGYNGSVDTADIAKIVSQFGVSCSV